ncbi:hypothetical protein [Tritonibacter mobilis]|uniref:hypothetical protein n=1 Tax=Tritonibacter mobilis TaxID=379347 RepID=UPI001C0857FA|nr:hypothetical protein [Tritonibacter mobilis]MBU3035946.1 hypothetical protein [Tritonibacter mobilis]WHQ85364.1 hypothetical protein OMR53_21800 [Tritonibacter mobilis]
MPKQFTNLEIKEARSKLGLTGVEMGRMLDINDPKTYRTYEMDPSKSQSRGLPPRAARLLQAYLDGWRPDDWPKESEPKKP